MTQESEYQEELEDLSIFQEVGLAIGVWGVSENLSLRESWNAVRDREERE